MAYIADLHIHSKYSRATSSDMDIEHINEWARVKGIDLIGTGDITHPAWLAELRGKLDEESYGIYKFGGTLFILSGEVSNIYFKNGKTRKVHNVLIVPDFRIAQEVQKLLGRYGDLSSDGRPVLGLDCEIMARELKGISRDIMIIPAHAWTPHFSVFGSNSGFDSVEECFGGQTGTVAALETGLSSDPPMNWRLSKLDRFTLVSNSDAHSPSKIGREANVFARKLGYKELHEALVKKDKNLFLFTVEFFPEEGKYHWDGHRKCGQGMPPAESKRFNSRCPICGRKVTVGVLSRIEALADRPEGFLSEGSPGYRRLVPLAEIIASVMGVGADTVGVMREYNSLTKRLGSEFDILLFKDEREIIDGCPSAIADAILKVRQGKVNVAPGYDGSYGKIEIPKDGDKKAEKQLTFF